MDFIIDILHRLPIQLPEHFSLLPSTVFLYTFVPLYYIVATWMQFSAMYQDFILVFQPSKIKSLLDITIRPFVYYSLGAIIVVGLLPSLNGIFLLIHILCLLIYATGRLTKWLFLKVKKYSQSQDIKLVC